MGFGSNAMPFTGHWFVSIWCHVHPENRVAALQIVNRCVVFVVCVPGVLFIAFAREEALLYNCGVWLPVCLPRRGRRISKQIGAYIGETFPKSRLSDIKFRNVTVARAPPSYVCGV